jgi:hypothetical protein
VIVTGRIDHLSALDQQIETHRLRSLGLPATAPLQFRATSLRTS